MTTDAWLAIAHHLAVFSLAAVLAAEWALVRRGMAAADIRRLARVDGATAPSRAG
jgi:putative membrane protein